MEEGIRIYLFEFDKIKSLLSISEKDLESSKIISNSKIYHNSIWFLLQSLEKTTKAFALMSKFAKFDELKRKISHNPLPMYQSDISSNLKKAENLEEAIKILPDLKKMPMIQDLDLEGYKQKAKLAQKILGEITKGNKIISDNPIELEIIINEMKQLIKEVQNIDMKEITEKNVKIYKDAWNKSVKAWIELSEKQGKPIDEAEKEQALSISEETIKKIADNVRANLILQGIIQGLNTTLNIILSPHFKFLRYPDSKNPLDYYTKKNPLVKKLDELIAIQKENISFHKEYFEILKRDFSNIKIEK